MKKKIKILFAAQDPGGFNTILPVIKELKKKKKFLSKLILANQSRNIAKKYGVRYQNGNYLTKDSLAKLIESEHPDLILTATSQGLSIEKKITKIARIQKIRTIAIIDFWSNYGLRFSDPGSKNLAYLPDYILVIDKIMKKEMTDQGFDPRKLIVTGSPFFDTFSKSTKQKERENLLVFFSQPFSELFKSGDRNYLGYNEIQVFEDLVEVLEKLQLKMPIKIKFHPRVRKLNKFDRIIKNSKLKISIEKKLSAEDLIKKSKLVMGMNSVVLFQTAVMGKGVLSYQPNLKEADPLISNRLGLSAAVYKKKDLYSELKKLLSAKPKKRNPGLIKKYTKNNSTKKVIDFIQSVI